jgi:phosphate transport system permease protein
MEQSPQQLTSIRELIAKSKFFDQLFVIIGLSTLIFSLIVLVALIFDLFQDGGSRLGLDFFTSFPSRRPSAAGVLSAWVGTSLVMLVTAFVSIPLGVGAGIYLEEYAKKNWISNLIEINVTNLAAVPSIVYGLLGLGIFKYGLHLGNSIATAGLTLSLLALPVIIVATREGIRAIPNTMREAAYAVGATKWQVVKDHILPYSSGTILTGVIVALARAIGETAPLVIIGAVTFIAYLPKGFSTDFPFITPEILSFSWLSSPFTVLPIQMFNWVSLPNPQFQTNAAAAGIVIIVMTLLMNGAAIYLRYQLRKQVKW